MNQLERLTDHIIDRINVNLREPPFDAGPYVRGLIDPEQFARFYAFYGLTPHHPLYFRFRESGRPRSEGDLGFGTG